MKKSFKLSQINNCISDILEKEHIELLEKLLEEENVSGSSGSKIIQVLADIFLNLFEIEDQKGLDEIRQNGALSDTYKRVEVGLDVLRQLDPSSFEELIKEPSVQHALKHNAKLVKYLNAIAVEEYVIRTKWDGLSPLDEVEYYNRPGDGIGERILYIVRGLPGSGKTTISKKLVDPVILCPLDNLSASPRDHSEFRVRPVYSADDYFTNEKGVYNFNKDKIKEAHLQCQENVMKAMSFPWVCKVAVANTFTEKWEARPYFELAEKYNFKPFVIDCQNDFGSIHEVPKEEVDKMKARWDYRLTS